MKIETEKEILFYFLTLDKEEFSKLTKIIKWIIKNESAGEFDDVLDGDGPDISKMAFELETEIGNCLNPKLDDECYYCGKRTNNLSADPGEWCCLLPHKDNPGVCKPHHNKCIMERLDKESGGQENR